MEVGNVRIMCQVLNDFDSIKPMACNDLNMILGDEVRGAFISQWQDVMQIALWKFKYPRCLCKVRPRH